jgi:hypothetical protein
VVRRRHRHGGDGKMIYLINSSVLCMHFLPCWIRLRDIDLHEYDLAASGLSTILWILVILVVI